MVSSLRWRLNCDPSGGAIPVVAPTPAKWIDYVVVMFPGSQRIVACRAGSLCQLVELASIFLPVAGDLADRPGHVSRPVVTDSDPARDNSVREPPEGWTKFRQTSVRRST
jgi:hypothetical protein